MSGKNAGFFKWCFDGFGVFRGDRLSIFRSLSTSEQKRVLLGLHQAVAEDLLSNLKDEEIEGVIRESDPDEGTDILLLVEGERRKGILGRVESDRRED
ncbi:MAG: magnesium transporter MgtE N-terminal domain-containing protein [Candidatus Hadarchaeota archaeon]